MITYKPIRKFLSNSNRKSSIRTLTQEASRIVGLELRIEEFKPITNAALLILTSEKSITLNENMSLVALGEVREENADESLLKLARKLAVILTGENVVSTYRTLGLKSI
ncbi:three component ABC system middle component [Pseudomonas syringae]|uniref:three component ABC system middle component n=1 Tax=Pseudomonas syringae TaxID=317 RepID=UPI00182CB765|nr:three component ABC system middle component [Pseudomonas syringae]NYS40866.1 hypothetical protein [Pseudomonas syringae pv. actinidiae]